MKAKQKQKRLGHEEPVPSNQWLRECADKDNDDLLTQIARKRSADWAANPGTPYDNTPIREAAKKGKP